MASKHVTTRELLRNFRKFKELLLGGKVHSLLIEVSDDQELELSMRKNTNSAAELAQRFMKLQTPLRIKRTNLFEELRP